MGYLAERKIGNITEVYATSDYPNESVGWITQSFPTNFHAFWTRKGLAKTEKVSDYKWVSDDEKATIEANDAKWEEPSEEFVKRWNVCCRNAYGTGTYYNSNTGFFELNELVDLTYDDAIQIYNEGSARLAPQSFYFNREIKGRTNIKPCGEWAGASALGSFRCPNAEVLNIPNAVSNNMDAFINTTAPKLRKILGHIASNNIFKATTTFKCPNLEYLHIKINKGGSLANCPKIGLDSWQWIVENSNNVTNPTQITVTVHLDVYCKLISSLTEEEATDLFTKEGVLDEEALASWKIIKPTLTAEEQAEWKAVWDTGKNKNISFAY